MGRKVGDKVTIELCGDTFVDATVIYRHCHICKKTTEQYMYQESSHWDARKCSECNTIQKANNIQLH